MARKYEADDEAALFVIGVQVAAGCGMLRTLRVLAVMLKAVARRGVEERSIQATQQVAANVNVWEALMMILVLLRCVFVEWLRIVIMLHLQELS